VQPLAALGVGLQQGGHAVQLVAGDEFEGLVEAAGLSFAPLGVTLQPLMAEHRNIFRLMKRIREAVLLACQGEPEAIVATFLGVSGCGVARSAGIPFFYAMPMPGPATRAFPHPLFPALRLGGGYNALTYRLAEGQIRRAYPEAACLIQEPRPTYLMCYSRHLAQPPADWPGYAHVTGFWFNQQAADWQSPETLQEFLQGGPPPVVAGFGSTHTADPHRLAEIVTQALTRAGQRGILITGWGGLQPGSLGREFYVAESLPFEWLFPRAAAVIHHGGAGTLAAAMRAGLPSVVTPFGLGQSFWARQAHRQGVAPEPLPPHRLTAARLGAALRTALEEPHYQENAARLGALIRAEDGVGNAVRVIEDVVGGGYL
jgi:UDP:flavonoid glycosyltransferase YjiC (YdhE family)